MATEDREGGTLVLSQDVPGYKREMLNVFSREEREAVKADFIIENWVAAAKRASAN